MTHTSALLAETDPAELAKPWAEVWNDYGPNWLRQCKKELSPEGERVARLVDWVFDGIYHQQRAVLRADWTDTYVRLTLACDLASFDASLLTRLVVGAHDHAIRVEISPCNFQYLEVMFHPRDREGPRYWDHHPTMEAALLKLNRGAR